MAFATICFAGNVLADTFPAYQWPERAYFCDEVGRRLVEDDFIARTLGAIWDSSRSSLRAEFGEPADWRASNPDCCRVYINDHSWSLRQSATDGLWGWLTLLLETPTIMVTVAGPEPDPENQWTGLRSRTYLLNACGGVKDRFGAADTSGEPSDIPHSGEMSRIA
jgi:hypothetical protein